MFDQALTAAQGPLPDGPFQGVPFLLKDLISTYAVVPTSCGNRLLKNLPADHDSELVRRLKAAGLVVLGKTNTPEFGLVPFTEPEAFGVTRNPTGPDFGEFWRGFVVEHALTRSVRDSAALLDATAGDDIGAPYPAPPPNRPFLEEVTTEPGRLRVAFTATPFLGHEVHNDCLMGLQAAIEILKQLGHEVVEDAPQIDREIFGVDFLTIVGAECRADMEWAAFSNTSTCCSHRRSPNHRSG
jgi:amidase